MQPTAVFCVWIRDVENSLDLSPSGKRLAGLLDTGQSVPREVALSEHSNLATLLIDSVQVFK